MLGLLSKLKLFPEILIGHSFGGKVVMSMADQFGRIGPRMPRPVQVCGHLACYFLATESMNLTSFLRTTVV